MKTRLARGTAAATVALAALAATSTAAAAPALTGSASSTLTSFVPTNTQQIGSYLLLQFDTTRVLTGALSGTVSESFTNLERSDGTIGVSGTGTFTGTLAGCGAVVLKLAVVGYANPPGDLHAVLFSLGGRPSVTGTVTGSVFSPFLSYQLTYRC